MKLADDLQKYPIPLLAFSNYFKATHNVEGSKFLKDVNNAMAIPHLIKFIEKEYKVWYPDVVYYTAFHNPDLDYNDVVMKGIKVVFFFIEHKRELNFEIY